MVRLFSLLFVFVPLTLLVGCFRNQLKPVIPKDSYLDSKTLPKPTPIPTPAPKSDSGVVKVSDVRPPVVDPSNVPAMPGIPGTPSRPFESPLPPAKPISADLEESQINDDDKKGPIRKLIEEMRERREEKEKEKAKEKEKEKEKEKDKEKDKDKPLPKLQPPVIVPDTPMEPKERIIPPSPPQAGINARKLVADATKKFEAFQDYECRLTKREVVNGKAMPTEEMLVQYRKDPFSVYMQVTGENGKGREVLYVKGQNQGKMIIVTGKGDNPILGVGKKMEFALDSPLVTGRNRHRIDTAGLTRTLSILQKFVDEDASGVRPSGTLRVTIGVERKEYNTPMTELDVLLMAGDDPLLPKGGRRKYFFDMDPKSPSHGLPVMIITWEHDKEVEYYSFTNYRLPAKLTDADFAPSRLGKK